MPLSDVIQVFLRDSGLGSRSRTQEVFQAWTEACSAEPARVRPVAFRNGELVVEVASSALLYELKTFTGDGFRRKANEILGEGRIRRLVVKLMS